MLWEILQRCRFANKILLVKIRNATRCFEKSFKDAILQTRESCSLTSQPLPITKRARVWSHCVKTAVSHAKILAWPIRFIDCYMTSRKWAYYTSIYIALLQSFHECFHEEKAITSLLAAMMSLWHLLLDMVSHCVLAYCPKWSLSNHESKVCKCIQCSILFHQVAYHQMTPP